MAGLSLFASFLSLALISGVNCRVLSPVSQNSILISEGVDESVSDQFRFLVLDPSKSMSENTCVHVYGFLPCSDNLGGYVFQVFSFGCLLIVGDYFLSEGRSKLFVIFEVGFYGGIVFPLLTMFPRIYLMLSSGLSSSSKAAESMVVNTVGVTVGYTVFALTLQWGACIAFGMSSEGSVRNGEIERTTSNGTSPRRYFGTKIFRSLSESRVAADPRNKKAAGIMLLTLTPFITVQLSEIFETEPSEHIVVLFALIISAAATVFYFVYSYFDTADQEKSLDHSRFELMSEVHKHFLFEKIDANNDGKIQISELKEVTVEFGLLGRVKCDIHKLAETLLREFDKDKDGEIDKDEFEEGITKLMKHYRFSFDNYESPRENRIEESGVLKVERPKKSLRDKILSAKTLRAAMEVVGGILVVIFLAKPFMMNIELLSESAGVPSFYVTFIVIPLARNLKNALSGHFCRKKDKARITSDTFSEIYRDVTMNNLMGMSIILAIVYTRGLTWNYSTEVLVIIVVGLVIGLPAYFRSDYPLWICVLAFALYFFSIARRYLSPLPRS